jgi:acyl-homoserine-lactone acylase
MIYQHIKYSLLAILTISLLSACSGSDDDDASGAERYKAKVTRTAYGIPHIEADDWGSLGYGFGYSYSQDNYCVLMREIVAANGQSAEFFGEEDGDLDADFIFQRINNSNPAEIQRLLDSQPAHVQSLIGGYVSGVNRYLRDTGVAKLAQGDVGCRNASWVRDIDALDLIKYFRGIQLQNSSTGGLLRQSIMDTSGPSAAVTASPDQSDIKSKMSTLLAKHIQGGSNGIALGSEYTQSGRGMLLANPHQPWQGSGRWYQAHLTIPGEYDVMGATLQGVPVIPLGFNDQLAWTHTVSFAGRFTLYELAINPANPLQYSYEGEMRDITTKTVQAKVKRADGNIETREHTFYESHFGLILNLKSLAPQLDGWPMFNGKVLSLRDANLGGMRALEQWIKMGQAKTIAEFEQAMALVGLPFFHTLAADKQGDAYYGQISVVPHVTQAQIVDCVNGLVGPLLAELSGNIILALDGSRAACEWGSDADSPDGENIFGYQALPKMVTTQYGANSNNSYWLSNPSAPLTGYPVIMGPLGSEGEQQFLRTQLTHQMVAERMNTSDGFSADAKFTALC